MLKKIISISFLILIFAFSFQLLINYLKVEHEVEYIIENDSGTFYVDEIYRKVKGEDYYFFDIDFNGINFLFQNNNYFNKQKEVIKDVKVFNNDSVSCLSLIYINDQKSSMPLCSKNGEFYSSYIFKDIDGFDEYLNGIPNLLSNVSFDDDKTSEISDLYINSGYIYDDEIFVVYNYKNIIKFDKELEELLPFSVYDNYKNDLGVLVDNYYLIPKMSSNPEYNIYLIFDIESGVIKDIEFSNPISKQLYINGIHDDKLYFFDKSNLIQYAIDPVNGKVSIVGDKNSKGVNYQNGVFSEISVYELKDDIIKFSEDTSEYDSIDYDLIFKFNTYAIYLKDGIFYKVYKNYLDSPIYLFKNDNAKEVKVKNDRIYFIADDYLYRYDEYGITSLVKREEFKYNFNNIYDVYIR